MTKEKLTEDDTIDKLMNYLESKGWIILDHCKGQKRGNDIVALKKTITLVIEAKGAKASETAPTKKRSYFDSGQIKTHFGKAIVKTLDEKHKNPKFKYAIAHPYDDLMNKSIGHLIPFLKTLDIGHFWVYADGTVKEV